MPAPFFTSNDSDFSKLEGLYIKELNPPAIVSGANLNVVSVCGEAIRGPVDRAITITSPARFAEVFGGRDQGAGGAITSKMYQALLNKPFGTLVVTRVAAAAASTSSLSLLGATYAAGTITSDAKSGMADADTFTINDGTNTVVFEFDVTGDGVTGGHIDVNISGVTTAAQVGVVIATAINAQFASGGLLIKATTVSAGGVVSLVHSVSGTGGNHAMSKSSSSGVFAVSGMSGALASTAVLTASASSPGSWGGNVTITIAAASDGNANHCNLTATYLGQAQTYQNLDISTGNDNTLSLLGTDFANFITLTKVASGVPATISATALSTASDGSIADSDYTAASRGLNVAATAKTGDGTPAAVVLVAEKMDSSIKGVVQTLAAASNDRIFLVSPDSETVSLSSAITEVGAFTRSDRIVYCFNSPYTIDPATATEIVTHPDAWMASILSQIDVDIHPGEEDCKPFLAAITRLYNESYQRADYISAKAAGIAALERTDGFEFVSGVTTSMVSGKTEITRRRMTDYIQLALADALKNQVKKKNTAARRASIVALANGFFNDLQKAERIVDDYNVDDNSLNTPNSRAQGIEKLFIQVKLIGHILALVLETQIGTSVTITAK